MARLEQAETGILLLCREDRRLVGVLTDGDVRRAILRNEPFDRPCGSIASRHAGHRAAGADAPPRRSI